jgi:hypothetical protein
MRWTVQRLCWIRAMKPEDTANLIASISAGISLLSGGFAFWAFRSSHKTAREQTALQAKLTAIEKERRGEEVEARRHAQVTVSITREPNMRGAPRVDQ